MWYVIILTAVICVLAASYFRHRPRLPKNISSSLADQVFRDIPFYRNLSADQRLIFIQKCTEFFSYVRIEGINVKLTSRDQLLVAASAIIPVFYFKKWRYSNLGSVLIYPHVFNREEFLSGDFEPDASGMVGNGPMQRIMILSLPQLREGFSAHHANSNVGIHEFIHLLDKEDGEVDGLPSVLIDNNDAIEYKKIMEEMTNDILAGNSDIDPYALTNRAEFFAVTSFYFFTAPNLFRNKHEALFNLYSKIFQWPAGQFYGDQPVMK